MGNLWGFLLQTVSVSLAAALLLVMKWLFRDKLSPRWQYGVWGILALRILLPASAARDVLLPAPLWLETAKAMAEKSLDSAYSAAYAPIGLRSPLPVFSGRPASVTDWLFAAYAAGIVMTLLWYLIAYVRLRLLLRRGAPASAELRRCVEAVCEAYGLKGCKTVSVSGLPSAFVCGVFRPVLAVPAGETPDEKILLHELLHLKYGDAVQSVLWCILRALHWCNPFLQYVFDRIGSDMEALCDQRVLERLEGEERRDYGGILLEMANERYPRAPGTTSLSNGGRNIARRIDSIVRFKRYPKGMGLVSVCIAVVLAAPVLLGAAAAYGADRYRPDSDGALERAMAMTRIRRCTTVAGAIDTYAKGLLYGNGIYIATASPLSRQEALAAEMRRSAEKKNLAAYHLDPGAELAYVDQNEGYYVYNLKKDAEGSYRALLFLSVDQFLNETGDGLLCNEAGEPIQEGAVSIPLSIRREDAWVVEEIGERQIYPGAMAFNMRYQDAGTLALASYGAEGDCGSVTVNITTVYTVSNAAPSGGWDFFGGTGFDESVKPAAQFEPVHVSACIAYEFRGTEDQRGALTSVGYQAAELSSLEETPQFPNAAMYGDGSGSSTGGWAWSNRTVDESWDGTLWGGSGGNGRPSDEDGLLAQLPAGYAVRIFWNGEAVEDFVIRGAEK